MTPVNANNPRLRELFLAASEDRLTAAEHAEWNTLLQNNSDARRAYLHLATLHGTLHQRFVPEAVAAGPDSEIDSALAILSQLEPSAPLPFRLAPFFWPAAAIVLFALTLVLAFSRFHVPSVPPAVAQIPESSARITGLVNVAWEDPTLSLHLDSHLPAGLIRLHAGLLRLELPTGTLVILQGPVQFQLDSQSKLTLQRGNLTAHVPPKGVGFSVTTPTATVTDLGTEFGVYVNRNDETHTEVFVGKVRLSTASETGAFSSQILHAGDSAQILDQATGIQSVPAEPFAFVRPDEFARIEQSHDVPAFARWLTFSQHLRNSPDLLAYYNFEPDPASSTRLPNLATATLGKFDGLITGANLDHGRIETKHALRFTGQTRIDLSIPDSVETVTLAAWVNPENLGKQRQAFLHTDHNGIFSSLLMTNGARLGAIHWQLMDGVRTELGIGISDSASVLFSRYRSMDLLSSQDDGRWMFVAITIDAQTRKIRHYLDGAVAGRNNENMQDENLSIGDAEIGNWNPLHRTDHPQRGFVGRIDEFAIFNRILSEQEIQSIYAAGSGI